MRNCKKDKIKNRLGIGFATDCFEGGKEKRKQQNLFWKNCSLPCNVTGIYQIILVNYTNGKLKDSLIESVHDIKGKPDRDEAWEHIHNIIQT